MGDGTDLYIIVKQEMNKVLSFYKQFVNGEKRMDAGTVWTLITSAVASFMRVAESATTLSGVDKKTLVLEAASALFDDVIVHIDIPDVPITVETKLLWPLLKPIYLKLVGGMIDSLANIFNRTGWFDLPAVTPTLPPPTSQPVPSQPVPSQPAEPTPFIPY